MGWQATTRRCSGYVGRSTFGTYTRTGVEKKARRIILFCSELERDSASHSFEEESTMLKMRKALKSWILHKEKKKIKVAHARIHYDGNSYKFFFEVCETGYDLTTTTRKHGWLPIMAALHPAYTLPDL